MSDEGFHRSMITHRDRFLELVRNPPSTNEAKNLAARFAVVQYVQAESDKEESYDLSADYFRFMFAEAVEPTNNRMTEAQGEKVAAWAKQRANGRVNIMFDCEASGVEGAKEALWFFAERQLKVRLLWSPAMHGGKFQGWQPETLTPASTSELFSR